MYESFSNWDLTDINHFLDLAAALLTLNTLRSSPSALSVNLLLWISPSTWNELPCLEYNSCNTCCNVISFPHKALSPKPSSTSLTSPGVWEWEPARGPQWCNGKYDVSLYCVGLFIVHFKSYCLIIKTKTGISIHTKRNLFMDKVP